MDCILHIDWVDPVNDMVMNCFPFYQRTFGTGEFGSSSTQEKSSIAIEKRADIVKPNVSPGKQKHEEVAVMKEKEHEILEEKKRKRPDDHDDDINVIQVKRRPKTILESSDEESNATEEKRNQAKAKVMSQLPKPSLLVAKRKPKPPESGDEATKMKKRGRPPTSRIAEGFDTSEKVSRLESKKAFEVFNALAKFLMKFNNYRSLLQEIVGWLIPMTIHRQLKDTRWLRFVAFYPN